jgi:hypothetical protein
MPESWNVALRHDRSEVVSWQCGEVPLVEHEHCYLYHKMEVKPGDLSRKD